VSGKLPKPIRDADEIMKWETKAEKRMIREGALQGERG
jgi:hypothetical protein